MKYPRISLLATLGVSVLGLSACSAMGSHTMYSQAGLPIAVQVPAGHKVAMETVGIGQITYECRAGKDMPSEHEWAFVGPEAKLQTRGGTIIGKYWGPPATWENNDGSRVTGTQTAVAPAGAGNIPLQLVKANPANGRGAMQDVTYIQRVATKGGVAPGTACGASNQGTRQVVQYQADYIFWRAI